MTSVQDAFIRVRTLNILYLSSFILRKYIRLKRFYIIIMMQLCEKGVKLTSIPAHAVVRYVRGRDEQSTKRHQCAESCKD